MHVVVTAGHVDHGKSALIRALTGMEPDRWAEERRRGMTIDLGFAWLTLPTGARLAFVDVPGHERFVPNMLAGAGPVPAVMFVVAADEGWMPQSAEHLAVIDALGISHGLLVVTKSDLADPAPAMAQAAAETAASSLGEIPALAVSATTGAGLPELLRALEALGRELPGADPGDPVRIWIDRAFTMTGSGTVVTGTLPAGTVHRGDELVVAPAMRPVRVRDLQTLGESAGLTSGPARVALNLRGVGKDALHRGMAVVQAGRWTLTDVIDVRIKAVSKPAGRSGGVNGHGPAGLAGQSGPGHSNLGQPNLGRPNLGRPSHGWADPSGAEQSMLDQLPRTVTLHVGTARSIARVRPLGLDLVRLSLADPLPLHVGDRVLLRDPGSRRGGSWPAVAGAVVLDVLPPPLARRGAAAAAARQLGEWPDQPTAANLLSRHGLIRASTLLAMGIDDHPQAVAGEWLADPEHWRALGHRLGEVVTSYAASEPLAAGMPLEAARAALDLPDRRLVNALARPPFRVACGALHLSRPAGADRAAELPESVLAAVRVLRADLAVAPFVSPDAERLRKLGLDSRSIAAAVRAGELLKISDQIVLAPGADTAAAAILAKIEQPFTAAQARQALDTTRRTAIPLLEFLDAAGVTQRLPDDRRVLRPADPVEDRPAEATVQADAHSEQAADAGPEQADAGPGQAAGAAAQG
jgi:selenocysteine-specific elongation factor